MSETFKYITRPTSNGAGTTTQPVYRGTKTQTDLIAEIKRRSPSAGAIKENASALEQAHRYRAAGASALKAPQKVFWGGYSGYYADPDGHVWEVAMNPFWPLSPDGSLTLPED